MMPHCSHFPELLVGSQQAGGRTSHMKSRVALCAVAIADASPGQTAPINSLANSLRAWMQSRAARSHHTRCLCTRRPYQYLSRDAKFLVQRRIMLIDRPRRRLNTSAMRVRLPRIASRSLRLRPCCSIRTLIASIGSGDPSGGARSHRRRSTSPRHRADRPPAFRRGRPTAARNVRGLPRNPLRFGSA